jgi:hypothetical protein
VQNCSVPILIELAPVRRKKAEARARWRESAPKDLAEQIADYCDPTRNYSRLVLRCAHGVYWADPEPVYDGDGEIVGWVPLAWECAVCFPQYLNRRSLPFRQIQNSPKLEYAICRFGPDRLDKWPRKGDRRIQLKGYFDDDLGIYFPPDHFVSPYDERFRMREPEAMGGYIRSGKKDGVGIRARLGWGETTDGGELRFHVRRGVTNDEAGEENWWTFYSAQEAEPSRLVTVTYDFSALPAPAPSIPYFNDERSIAATRQEKGIVFYRRIGSYSWSDTPPEMVVTQPGKKRRSLREHGTAVRFDERHSGQGGQIGHCCGECKWCQSLRLKSQCVPSVVSIRPFSWKERWSDKWRTERPMRDLAARLNMYRYGSGTVDVKRMMATAWENLRQSQDTCKPPTLQRSATYETHGGYRESSEGGAPLRKCDGNYRHRLEDGFWPEVAR